MNVSGWLMGRQLGQGVNDVTTSVTSAAEKVYDRVSSLITGVQGSVQKPLPELLTSFGLPAGLLPKNVSKYEFNKDEKLEYGNLTVILPYAMDVKFSDGTILRFRHTFSCVISRYGLSDIVGLKMSGIMWSDVQAISLKDKMLQFQTMLTKKKPCALFEVPKDGVEYVVIK